MSNLAYTTRLLESPCPTLFSYGNFHFFIYIFVQYLLVLGYIPSPCVTLSVLHVAPVLQKIAK